MSRSVVISTYSNRVVIVKELDISGPLPVGSDELFISRRTFIPGVTCKHALDAHANALHALHGTPTLLAQEI